MCGSFSPPASRRSHAPGQQAEARRAAELDGASNSSCIPRQTPSSGTPASSALARQLVEAQRRAGFASPRGNAPTPGTTSPSAARSSSWSLVIDGARRPRARAPSRPSGGCPSRSRRSRSRTAAERSRQRPLRARHAGLGGVDRDRRAQRAGERLERRLDHVVGVRARLDAQVQRQLGRRRDGAEELLGQLVVEAGDRARAAARRERAERPAGDVDRARRAAPRPSARSRGRSGRSRARSPSASSSAWPRQMPVSSTVWCAPVSRSP